MKRKVRKSFRAGQFVFSRVEDRVALAVDVGIGALEGVHWGPVVEAVEVVEAATMDLGYETSLYWDTFPLHLDEGWLDESANSIYELDPFGFYDYETIVFGDAIESFGFEGDLSRWDGLEDPEMIELHFDNAGSVVASSEFDAQSAALEFLYSNEDVYWLESEFDLPILDGLDHVESDFQHVSAAEASAQNEYVSLNSEKQHSIGVVGSNAKLEAKAVADNDVRSAGEPTSVSVVNIAVSGSQLNAPSDLFKSLAKVDAKQSAATPITERDAAFVADGFTNEGEASEDSSHAKPVDNVAGPSQSATASLNDSIDLRSMDASETSTQMMTPKVRELGYQLATQMFSESSFNEHFSATVVEHGATDGAPAKVVATYVVSIGPISHVHSSVADRPVAEARGELFAGVPIDPLAGFEEFDIFTAIGGDVTELEVQESFASNSGWFVGTISLASSLGWIVKRKLSKSESKETKHLKDSRVTAFDHTVRATVQWSG